MFLCPMTFKTCRCDKQHVAALDLLPGPGRGGEDRGDGDPRPGDGGAGEGGRLEPDPGGGG